MHETRRSGRHRSELKVLLAIFFLTAGTIFVVVAMALHVQSTLRAYATAESVWAKARMRAVFSLRRYARSGNPEHRQIFERALRVIDADRDARLALSGARPDYERARDSFVRGGNHADDVAAMALLFRAFRHEERFEPAVRAWEASDLEIARLRLVAEKLARIHARGGDMDAVVKLMDDVVAIDGRLSVLEQTFVTAIGETGRSMTTFIVAALAVLTGLMALLGALFAFRRVSTPLLAEIDATERRFRAIFEGAPTGIAVTTTDGHLLRANRAFARMLGYRPEELTELTLSDVSAPDSFDESGVHRAALLDGTSEYRTYEKSYVTREGRRVWTTVTATFDAATGCIIKSIEDITARREAEEALRRSESRFRSLCDTAFDGIIVSRGGIVTDVNRACADMYGCEPRDLIGLRIEELAVPEMRDFVSRQVANGTLMYESIALRPDGTRFPVEVCGINHDLEAGERVAALRDLTEKRAIEEERQARDAYFRSLIENASDAITVFDTTGVIRYQSPSSERLLGLRAESLIGRNVLELLHPEDYATGVRGLAMQVASPDANGAGCLRLRHRDGTWRSFDIVMKNIVRNGSISIIANARDVTERRTLEEQLEQARRLDSLGRVAASITHEFNNVMMGILPFAEVIGARSTDEGTRKAVERIKDSIGRGKRITAEILRFTRPATPVLTPVPVRDWLSDVETEIRPLLPPAVTLTFEADASLACSGDRAQLTQVMMNLLTNARDAMGETGEIHVSARAEEFRVSSDSTLPARAGVHIRVRDNGAGMTEETLKRLYEPLFTTKRNGTGLGLPICHQIVEKHHGRLFAESELGNGTTFHLLLPDAEIDGTVPAMPMLFDAANEAHAEEAAV